MQTYKKRLPSLDLLVAFEAAARHSSFQAAAEELNVTASAISQQIRNLESQMDLVLFSRGHRSVQLTDQGREFQANVTFALTHLASAVDELQQREGTTEIVLATDTSIASQWLIPKLAEFDFEQHNLSLNLKISDIRSELLNGEADVAIIHGDGRWEGYETTQLFEEEVFPVCSPKLLSQKEKKLDLAELANFKLLELDYEHWHWMNWPIWLSEAGNVETGASTKIRSNYYSLVIEAAKQGLGLALGWRYFVDDDLDAGVLVRPFRESVKTRNGYHVVSPYNRRESNAVAEFRKWLLSHSTSAT